ncbi:hypothetical protein HPB49_011617 [Dermacentor silvarum]|uniref:Uncharacterized protein n=1 Tax=Dermacentor silvarum TaxID=543639 RepID=A0ACB8E006_DERSI|nr:hypothetical protein HPB49_011617 [Dermacentor silvarum]
MLESRHHDYASPEQQVEQSASSSWEQLSRLDAILPGVDFAEYISADASADMDAAEHLDDGGFAKLAANAEKVSEDDDTEENVDHVPAASEAMDVVDLLRRFAGSRGGGEQALVALLTSTSLDC